MAGVVGPSAVSVGRHRRLARYVGLGTQARRREALWGYIFAVPWLIGLLVFAVGPILASLLLSLTKYDVISPPTAIGLTNYVTAFTNDSLFWSSLGRTFEYALVIVPVGLAGSLLLALILNQGVVGTNVFRMLYFLPSLTPAVAAGILWQWIFDPTVGPVNFVIGSLGLPKPGWLASPTWAMPAVMLISLWGVWGGNNMLIFLAGLQGVPVELYDASAVDGASRWTRFVHITLPMISPTIFFNLVLGIIGALKVFSLAYVATQGGPAYATWFFALHIYNQAFNYFQMGYACALAWIFTVILLIFTVVQVRLANRWVYYAGGDRA
jgi:multiple sugar transport system permease protein